MFRKVSTKVSIVRLICENLAAKTLNDIIVRTGSYQCVRNRFERMLGNRRACMNTERFSDSHINVFAISLLARVIFVNQLICVFSFD